MNHKLVRILSGILLGVMLVASLASCAAPAATPQATQAPAEAAVQPTQAPVEPTTPPTEVPTEAVAPTAAAPEPTAAPEAPAGEVIGVKPVGDGNLTLWVAGNTPDIQKAFNEVIANFEKNNPGFKVTVEYIPWGDLSTKLTTALAGGVGPDVFMHGVAASAGFMSKDQIEDLTPYFSQLADKDDFLPNLIEAGTVNGKLAMMPVQVTNYMLIYRKDLYKEAGLDPENPPKTWDELLAAAEKLTKSDAMGITMAGLQMPTEGSDVEMAYAPILRTMGGDILSADGKTAGFNTPEGLKALQLYVDMFHKSKVSSLTPLPGDPNVSLMGRGVVAQIISGQFDLADIKATDPKVYEQIGVALPPAGDSGKVSTMSSFSGFMMNKGSKNKDDAWTLLRHIVSPSSLVIIDSTSLFLPPRASLQSADFVTQDPLFKQFADGLQYGKGNPNIPAWIQIRNTLTDQLVSALNQQMTPEEALKKAEEEVNKLLAQ